MEVSFQGIGAWCATFMGEELKEGQVVKVSGSGAAAACAAGDDFCGVVVKAGPETCAVQLGGMAAVAYSGTAPELGYTALCADGSGGVKTATDGGRSLLVAAVDTAAQRAVIKL